METYRSADKELRDNMCITCDGVREYTIVRNFASSAGGSATARSMASMESWIATNIAKATTTSSSSTPGFSGGTVAAPTDGTTTGAFTEASLVSAISKAWVLGGSTRTVLVGTSQKAAIDAFVGQATRFVNVDRKAPASIIGSANVYVSSYGVHTIVLHRHIRSTIALCVDSDYWAIAFLRNPFMEQLAKTGDGYKYHMIAEGTLVCRNERASSKVVSCS